MKQLNLKAAYSYFSFAYYFGKANLCCANAV